ncbi:uncharacterized protein V6R79_018386 [Siganus canaliculatus]
MRLQAVLLLLVQLLFELSSCTQLRVSLGSTLKLPCHSIQTEFTDVTIIWKFNGENIKDQPSGSTSIKDNGLYLSISPVTTANEGKYVCLVRDVNMEIIREYDITVDASVGYSIKVVEGVTVHLPCHFPPSSQATANALWFKDTGVGKTIQLNLGNSSTFSDVRIEQMYPDDTDQTILIRDSVTGDAGIYSCQSVEGKKLSTVYLVVEAAPAPVPYSCSGFTTEWESCENEDSRTGEPVLQESMAEFSMKLYSYFRELLPSGNLLFSPMSINGVLSHLLLGARGDTRRDIERAVCLPHDFHCVHFQMKKLKEKLASSLQMASQIYYNPQLNLTKSFTKQSIQFYDAAPVKLLETTEENTDMINNWVANKTDNKIKHLVDSVPPSTQLMLLNAVSFSGHWKIKFGAKNKKELFTKLDGDLVTVPVLYHRKYMVAMTMVVPLKAQVARFALSGDNSLYILLPRSNSAADLQQVEEKMTDRNVHLMIDQLETVIPEPVEVTLPKIKLDVQPDLNALIKKLGLFSLFEDPNLCGLYSEDRLILDDARHRAFLALTKEGVEAGAATSVSFSRTFPSFTALRPFILLLWSDQANVPLFVGRVTEP